MSVGQSRRRDFCGALMGYPKEVVMRLQIWLEECVSDRISACSHCQLETNSEETLVGQSPRTSPGGARQSMFYLPLRLQ